MKRLIAWVLTLALITSVTVPVYANPQDPVDRFWVSDVSYVEDISFLDNSIILNPTMTINWEDPDTWNLEDEYDIPDYYQIDVTNLSLGGVENFTINNGTEAYDAKTLDLHNEMDLETGSLYEMSIYPYHEHEIRDDDGNIIGVTPQMGVPEIIYGLTDVTVEFISGSDEIQVIWDDLGDVDFEYRISYALGEYATLNEVLDNAEGTDIVQSSDDRVTQYFDAEEGRDKLLYTIDSNIIPGQTYSIIVESVVDSYEGDSVARNRYYPYIYSVSTSIELFLDELGEDIILTWEIPSSYEIDGDTSTLAELTIYESEGGSSSPIAIFDDEAGAVGYYRIPKPDTERIYYIEVSYSNQAQATVSNEVTYSPTDYLIQPTTPVIPRLLTEDILNSLLPDADDDLPVKDDIDDLDDTVTALKDQGYMLRDYDYEGNVADILEDTDTFHTEATGAFNFVWEAFERLDVDTSSDTYGQPIKDNDIYYDIYISDDLSGLGTTTPIYEDVYHTSVGDEAVLLGAENEEGEREIVGYTQLLSRYYKTATDDSPAEVTDITAGKLYYIGLQAKKVTGIGTLTSDLATVAVYFDYDGDDYEPPTISKPPLQEKTNESTETGITMIWKESWWEIISPEVGSSDVLYNWQNQLWMENNGNLSATAIDGEDAYDIYEGLENIQAFIDDYNLVNGLDWELDDEVIAREVSLASQGSSSDILYQFLNIRYDQVLDAIAAQNVGREEGDPDYYTFEDYIVDLIEADRDGTSTLDWLDIVPETDDDDSSYKSYREEGLLPNTSYLFILMPYRDLLDNQVLYAQYPATLLVSTPPETDDVTPDPTVPNLYTSDYEPTSMTVQWKYNSDFTYELYYSTGEDVNAAIPYNFELPDVTDPTYPEDGDYFPVTVDDLFPLTTYYFWIRATQPVDNTTSDWSNPVEGTTTDVDEPVPPRGFGLTSEANAAAYGYEDNVGDDYLIVEWLRDVDDIETTEVAEDEETNVTFTYTYIIELADNDRFVDPVYVESSGGESDIIPEAVSILEKNLVEFGELVGNRHYYVRAKTRLVVTGSEDGQEITKDSASYTSTIRILTIADGTEYDGNIDPALTILPERDFELIYDSDEDLLEFRFRSNETDDDGELDNAVDQRLISDLINDNATEYVIDLISYSNRDVDSRRVTMPFSIVEAFDSYGVDLIILTEDMILAMPHDSVVNHVEDQVSAYGVAPTLVIDILELDMFEVRNDLPDSEVIEGALPQELQVRVVSDRRTDQIYYADEEITVQMLTTVQYGLDGDDMVVMEKDSRGNWEEISGDYNSRQDTMTFETANIGTYGVYAYNRSTVVDGINTNPNHWAEDEREVVYSEYGIEGLESYFPDVSVSQTVVVQAIHGMVMGERTIDLSGRLSSSELQTMERAGILETTEQHGGTIERQEAMHMFVRAYEMMNRNDVSYSQDTLAQVQALGGVDGDYAISLAKALNQGLIVDVNDIRPTDALDYGEFFALWSRTIE